MIDVPSNQDFLIAITAAERQAEEAQAMLEEKLRVICDLEARISEMEEQALEDKEQALEYQRMRLLEQAEQERLKLEDAFCERINKLEQEVEEKNAYIETLEKEGKDRMPEPVNLTYPISSTVNSSDPYDELDLKDPPPQGPASRSYARPSLAHVVGERQKRKMSVKDLTNAWSNRKFAT